VLTVQQVAEMAGMSPVRVRWHCADPGGDLYGLARRRDGDPLRDWVIPTRAARYVAAKYTGPTWLRYSDPPTLADLIAAADAGGLPVEFAIELQALPQWRRPAVALAAHTAGWWTRDIGHAFGVTDQRVYQWLVRARLNPSPSPLPVPPSTRRPRRRREREER
jgi:hypothetical protein